MITENDLRISSQSYTNKDFEAVYNELLTLAKKISYKYDPTSSNESDPFIVLLKLLAKMLFGIVVSQLFQMVLFISKFTCGSELVEKQLSGVL